MNKILFLPKLLLCSLRLTLLVVLMVLAVSIGSIVMLTGLGKQRFGFWLRNRFCKVAHIILGIKLIRTGELSQKPGTLYVGNHRSLLDPLIVYYFIKEGYAVSKAEVEHYPVIGYGAKMCGVIYVDRKDSQSRNSAKNKIVEKLREKLSIVLFPEGTISVRKEILPFKKGSFEAAAELGSPVVPFAMEYMNPSSDFWFHEHLILQFFYTASKWKTTVRVHFFDPIHNLPFEQLLQYSEQNISQKLTEFQKFWNKEEQAVFNIV
ncbi:MAG TPA: lysophospholipid acyltransferase family protein [Saprospiraceae bacterium]|nr:lysophospholipid acyltransferase family protein [Saprospiraceae bacterium]